MEISAAPDVESLPKRREDTVGYRVVQSILCMAMLWAFYSYRQHWRLSGHQWIEIAAISLGIAFPKQSRWRWVCFGIWTGCFLGELADHIFALAGIGIGGK